MGMFDNEDDEQPRPLDPKVREYLLSKQKGTDVGPPVTAAAPHVQERSYEQQSGADETLADKYSKLAGDTAAIDTARSEADSANRRQDIIEGLATMFAGTKKVDGSFYAGKRAQNEQKVTDAKAAHQKKLSDLLTHDKIAYQDVERGRATKADTRADEDSQRKAIEFGWKEGDNDPKSNKAASARMLIAKSTGSDPTLFADLGYSDIMEVGKQLTAAKVAAKKSDGANFQQTNVEVPGKGVFKAVFNPSTGEYKITEHLSGYKSSIDNTAGLRNSGADFTAPATPITTADGTPMADVRTKVDAERAYANTTATQTAKDEQAVQEAEAQAVSFDDKSKRWLTMYDQAYAANRAGPGGGQLGKFQRTFGFSSDRAADQLANEMALWGNQYIHDTTGASMPMQEFRERFQPVLPQIGDDPQLIRSKMAGFKQALEGDIKKRKMVAGPAPAAAPQQDTGAKQFSPDQEAKIKAYMEKYPSKTREQIIKAMGL